MGKQIGPKAPTRLLQRKLEEGGRIPSPIEPLLN